MNSLLWQCQPGSRDSCPYQHCTRSYTVQEGTPTSYSGYMEAMLTIDLPVLLLLPLLSLHFLVPIIVQELHLADVLQEGDLPSPLPRVSLLPWVRKIL